jgi:hypothetical protein
VFCSAYSTPDLPDGALNHSSTANAIALISRFSGSTTALFLVASNPAAGLVTPCSGPGWFSVTLLYEALRSFGLRATTLAAVPPLVSDSGQYVIGLSSVTTER